MSVTWTLRGWGPRRRRHRGRGRGGRENEKILLSSTSQNVLKGEFLKNDEITWSGMQHLGSNKRKTVLLPQPSTERPGCKTQPQMFSVPSSCLSVPTEIQTAWRCLHGAVWHERPQGSSCCVCGVRGRRECCNWLREEGFGVEKYLSAGEWEWLLLISQGKNRNFSYAESSLKKKLLLLD